MTRFVIAAAAAWMFSATAVSAAPVLVPQDSQVSFTSRQMGVPVQGRFGRYDAQVDFDPAQPQLARIALTLDMASATLGSSEVDAQLAAPDWFDVKRHPTARFESAGVQALGKDHFEVRGRLTIKGRSRDIAVPVDMVLAGVDGRANGTLAIRRLDFGIGDGAWRDTAMVADEVQVRFSFALKGFAAPAGRKTSK